MNGLNFVTFNVRGLTPNKYSAMTKLLEDHRIDIALIQETHLEGNTGTNTTLQNYSIATDKQHGKHVGTMIANTAELEVQQFGSGRIGKAEHQFTSTPAQ